MIGNFSHTLPNLHGWWDEVLWLWFGRGTPSGQARVNDSWSISAKQPGNVQISGLFYGSHVIQYCWVLASSLIRKRKQFLDPFPVMNRAQERKQQLSKRRTVRKIVIVLHGHQQEREKPNYFHFFLPLLLMKVPSRVNRCNVSKIAQKCYKLSKTAKRTKMSRHLAIVK